MGDIRAALREVLLGDVVVFSLVDGERVYPVILQQGVKEPSVVINRVSSFDETTLEGQRNLPQLRIQVDSWAKTLDAANALSKAVRSVLAGFSGEVFYGADSPQQSVAIHGIFFVTEADGWDEPSRLYRHRVDYTVWYREV